MYELRGVVRRYGATTAVDGIHLSIGRGERVALAGPSGAGKTTVLRMLNGMIPPTEGEVRAFGRDLGRLSRDELRDVQGRIGTIHQQLHLVDSLRVIHNVNAGHLGRWSLPRAALSLVLPREVETAARALERVGIGEKLFERTDRLSGGERQRVAIARALIQGPEVLLADEPISSLDVENSRRVLDLFRDLSRREGLTLVASMHDVRFALSHFARVVGLREGRVLFDRPAGEVTDDMTRELYSIERIHARAPAGPAPE